MGFIQGVYVARRRTPLFVFASHAREKVQRVIRGFGRWSRGDDSEQKKATTEQKPVRLWEVTTTDM